MIQRELNLIRGVKLGKSIKSLTAEEISTEVSFVMFYVCFLSLIFWESWRKKVGLGRSVKWCMSLSCVLKLNINIMIGDCFCFGY